MGFRTEGVIGIVRKSAGIVFLGETREDERMYIVDCKVEGLEEKVRDRVLISCLLSLNLSNATEEYTHLEYGKSRAVRFTITILCNMLFLRQESVSCSGILASRKASK